MAIRIYEDPASLTSIPISTQGNIVIDPNIPEYVTPLDIDLLKYKPILPPIDYSNLDFSSIKLQLLNLMKANSSTLGYTLRDFADSNTAGMFLNLVAYTGQMISYHTDSMVNELFLDTAQSNWAAFKLLNVFGYKPSRPKSGAIVFSITRRPSTNSNSVTALQENSAEVIVSSSSSRLKLQAGSENYEIFPAIVSEDNVLTPDFLGDLIIPAFVSVDSTTSSDAAIIEIQKNTYYCFGLTGTTVVEDYVSNGSPNQSIFLNNSPLNDSVVIAQVEDTTIKIPGRRAYETWSQLDYLSLAGFKTSTSVGSDITGKTPYLTTTFKLNDSLYASKVQGTLDLGTMVAINYSNELQLANYEDFVSLLVPYKVGIISALISNTVADDHYVDVLIYHPNYVYGESEKNTALPYTVSALVNTVKSSSGEDIPWRAGDILYLLNSKLVPYLNGQINQPQIVSDTQISLADEAVYRDIQFLKHNQQHRIAIGKALTSTTLALGLSADTDNFIQADKVYELSWDGDFKGQLRFGDGIFGKIPEKDAAIKVIYRINDLATLGGIVKPGESLQTAVIDSLNFVFTNEFSSSPATQGETIDQAKLLATRFFAAQDRAVTSDDYLALVKKYNPNIKVLATVSKVDADANTIRLYTLIQRPNATGSTPIIAPLTATEKLQLLAYINIYKCMGIEIEIIDGIIRNLDLRLDLRLNGGYLSGQVKSDASSIVLDYFSTNNFELGQGLDTAKLIKSLAQLSGIKSMDIYLGGYSTVVDSSGNEIQSPFKIYQTLKDIPGYDENTAQFPTINSQISTSFSTTDKVKAWEILLLDKLEINTLGR